MNDNIFGPQIEADGTTFRLWAPAAKRVDLLLDHSYPMTRHNGGWHELKIGNTGAGTRYQFRIDGDLVVPDPASHFQPDDISAPSQVIDHDAFQWRATNWLGRPWHETVLLEAHVGAFTDKGSYKGVVEKLDHLVNTGITALELMPLADFPGRRNWGYDGVLWYAPDHVYGTPDDLKILIDEAHLRGLMVFLDVVYNHFGPDGNYLGFYAPQFFCDAQTPWGSAIDYTIPEVRKFTVENALHWLTKYRFDGLRLDAVHAITSPGTPSILSDLSHSVGALAKMSGRHIHLVLENDDNCASLLSSDQGVASGRYRAQWNDDYHHAWHALLTNESAGYYCDYAKAPIDHLRKMLGSGFAYSGELSEHRDNKPRGELTTGLSPLAFVNFLQNHDQIGNRAFGDRLTTLAEPAAIEAALAITLLAPMPPMIFMGEEWGAEEPFPFFCDFQGELANSIRAGRRKEFAQSYAQHGENVPDPLWNSTFASSILDWSVAKETNKHRHELVRNLLIIRNKELVPYLEGALFKTSQLQSGCLLIAEWILGNGRSLQLTANLSEDLLETKEPLVGTNILWSTNSSNILNGWSVIWSLDNN